MAEGDTDEAAAAYERATGLAPDLWQAWLNRGICLRRLSRFEEAIDCLKKAVNLKPKDDVIYERLGRILYRAILASYIQTFSSARGDQSIQLATP
jgi:tetratricopeptide (TPR) repeat protein